MRVGQPKLSVKSQRSGLLVTPTKSERRVVIRVDDLRLKERVTVPLRGRHASGHSPLATGSLECVVRP